jgi:hypothetical protein
MSGKSTLAWSVLAAAGLVAAPFLAPRAVAATAPIVQITSPTADSTVKGNVTVDALGQTDPSGTDAMNATMQLIVDGQPYDRAYACQETSGGDSCPSTLPWDANGLSGTHTLAARFTTASGVVVDSPTETVTVVDPTPTAEVFQISAIQAGGVATVEGIGGIDPSQTDSGSHMQLYVDGAAMTAPAYTQRCGGATPIRCDAFFKWDTTGLSGPHTVAVLFTTARGYQAMSAPLTYDVFGATTTTLDMNIDGIHGPFGAGGPTAISGQVNGMVAGVPVAHAPVKLTFTPVVGSPTTITTNTDASGIYSVNYTPKANTTISVTAGGTARWGASTTSAALTVAANLSCSVAHGSVTHGHSDTITCKLPGLPSGTATTLQYRSSGGKWITYGHGHATASKSTFNFTLKHKGSYLLEVTTATNHAYGPSAGIAKVKLT